MQLIVIDESKAKLFSFTAHDTDSAINELMARGWSADAALEHVNAAINSGAYHAADAARAESATAEAEEMKA